MSKGTRGKKETHPGFGRKGPEIGGAAVAMTGGYKESQRQQALAHMDLVPPETPRPRGVNVMRVAKIDPDKRRAAIIPIKATMKGLKVAAGAQHIGQQMVTQHSSGVQIDVIVHHERAEGKVWKVRGSLPVRGRAILIGVMQGKPVDFPADNEWLKRMIDFDCDQAKAINDPRPKKDA